MQLLITGTGRCGTKAISKWLNALGLDLPHEDYGLHGTVDWRLAPPELRPVQFNMVIHIMRSPHACISSFHTAGKQSWEHIFRCFPFMRDMPLTRRCMAHYYYWNCLCFANSDLTVKLDSFDEMAPEVLDLIDATNTNPPKLSDYSQVNARNYKLIPEKDLSITDDELWRSCNWIYKHFSCP